MGFLLPVAVCKPEARCAALATHLLRLSTPVDRVEVADIDLIYDTASGPLGIRVRDRTSDLSPNWNPLRQLIHSFVAQLDD